MTRSQIHQLLAPLYIGFALFLLFCAVVRAADKVTADAAVSSDIFFSATVPGCQEGPGKTTPSGFTFTMSCYRNIGSMHLEPKGWVIKIARGFSLLDLIHVAKTLPRFPLAEALTQEVEQAIQMKRHAPVLRVEDL